MNRSADLARVYLAECRARRHSHVNRNFYWVLFDAAQSARRRASQLVRQRELFA